MVYEDVLLRIGDAQKAELQRMVVVEAEHEGDVDGDEPCESCHTVEDASQTALLPRQPGQLPVGAVKQIRHTEQKDSYDVEPQPVPTLVDETAVIEEVAAGSPYEHRGNGDGVGMNV